MLRFKNQNLANLRQTFAISAAAPFQLIFLLIGTFSRKVLTEFRNRFCEWKKVNRTTTSSFGILSLFLRNDLTSFPSFLSPSSHKRLFFTSSRESRFLFSLSSFKRISLLPLAQCDQIWRNFATLAQF